MDLIWHNTPLNSLAMSLLREMGKVGHGAQDANHYCSHAVINPEWPAVNPWSERIGGLTGRNLNSVWINVCVPGNGTSVRILLDVGWWRKWLQMGVRTPWKSESELLWNTWLAALWHSHLTVKHKHRNKSGACSLHHPHRLSCFLTTERNTSASAPVYTRCRCFFFPLCLCVHVRFTLKQLRQNRRSPLLHKNVSL